MSYFMRLQARLPDAAVAQAVQLAIINAKQTWQIPFQQEYPDTGFGIAPITAKNVAATNQATGLQGTGVAGSSAWGITAVTVSTWTDWVNLTIDDRTYHIVGGFFNRTAAPHIVRIRPKANGQDQPALDIEQVYLWEEIQGYLEQPYVVRPGANHTIRVLTDATIAGVPAERIGLLGYMLAKKAYLIAE